MIYEQRQVYRLISDESCNKWIETLNAAIIYAKFFWKLLQESNNEVTKYFSKLKEEVQFIEFEKSIDEEYKQNQLNTIQNSKKNSMNGGKGNSDANNTNNKNSKLEKKKERRKNPHTNSGKYLNFIISLINYYLNFIQIKIVCYLMMLLIRKVLLSLHLKY